MKKIRLIALILVCLCGMEAYTQDSLYFRANQYIDQLDNYYRGDSVEFPDKGRVLFVGSSSIAMWKNIESYFPNHEILARGFGGAWISDVLYHFDRLVYAYRPGQIVLYAGENDLTNGKKTPQQVADDIKCFVRLTQIHLPGVPLIILSIKPSPKFAECVDAQKEANDIIEDFCLDFDHTTFVDVFSLLMGEQGQPNVDLYLEDGLHINNVAYRKWADIITPCLIVSK